MSGSIAKEEFERWSKQRDEEMMFLVERTHKLVNALEAVAMMRSIDECPLAAEMRKIALDAITPTE